ncbi:hypothetical protein D3C77_373280 [compost metagenome]
MVVLPLVGRDIFFFDISKGVVNFRNQHIVICFHHMIHRLLIALHRFFRIILHFFSEISIHPDIKRNDKHRNGEQFPIKKQDHPASKNRGQRITENANGHISAILFDRIDLFIIPGQDVTKLVVIKKLIGQPTELVIKFSTQGKAQLFNDLGQ